MAEKIKLKVKCHACGNVMEGSAKYGSGHYVPDGLDFAYVATSRVVDSAGKVKVRGEVEITCPNCTVRNRYQI